MRNTINFVICFVIFLISIAAFGQDVPVVIEPSWIDELLLKLPWLNYILVGLGSLVVLAQVIVVITPTKKDNEFMEKTIVKKICDIFLAFAPIKKK